MHSSSMKNDVEHIPVAIAGLASVITRFAAEELVPNRHLGSLGAGLLLANRHLENADGDTRIETNLRWGRALIDEFTGLLFPGGHPDQRLERLMLAVVPSEDKSADRKRQHEISAQLRSISKSRASVLKAIAQDVSSFNKRCAESSNTIEQASTTRFSSNLEDLTTEQSLAYMTLQQQITCCNCVVEQAKAHENAPHLGNLYLRPELIRDASGSVQLDLLFYTSKQSQSSSDSGWQDISLEISTRISLEAAKSYQINRKRKQVTWGDGKFENTSTTNPNPTIAEEVIQGGFCQYLLRCSSVRICFKISSTMPQLHNPSTESIGRFVKTVPSVSLTQVLIDYHLTTRMRVSLAYILARSVWQYYDSPWMKRPWTNDVIHFVTEFHDQSLEDETDLYPHKPYLAIAFNDDGEAVDQDKRPNELPPAHKYPKLLALAIMLVEIGRGQPLPRPQHLYDGKSETWKMERDQTQAFIYASDPNSWPGFDTAKPRQTANAEPCNEMESLYRAVILQCLNSKRIDPLVGGMSILDGSTTKVNHQRRKILYKTIVAPLEDLMRRSLWYDQIDTLEAAEINKKAKIVKPESEAPLKDNPSCKILSKKQRAAEEWFETISRIHEIASLRQPFPKTMERPLVAILDTGYDMDSVFFDSARRSRRLLKKNWLDLAEGSDQPVDEDGHGTAMVSLVMQMAPDANICMVRIARKSSDLDSASENVATAIRWASTRAQIILMSFGFHGRQPLIDSAIHDVLGQKDLIFLAAAANRGGNALELFPASHESVISIHATDADGRPLPLNPPRNPREAHTLCVLGLKAPCASLSTSSEEKVYLDGTSVAAAIAAGLCAMILTYVDRNHARKSYDSVKTKLCSRLGMLGLLEEISKVTLAGYRYIRPEALIVDGNDISWEKVWTGAHKFQ